MRYAYILDMDTLLLLMKQRGVSQRDIAEYLGLSPATVSNKIKGHRQWRLREALALSELFDGALKPNDFVKQ